MRSFIKNIFIILATLTTVFGFSATAFAAGNIDSVKAYSQFLNTDLDNNSTYDLINWNPTNGGATVSDSAITGYIWGETVGWINMNPKSGGVINTCKGQLRGYAWGQNTGWINFNPTNATIHPNINTTTGEITGQVWSQNYGWIELASPQLGNLGLKTSWRPGSHCNPTGGSNPTLTVSKVVVGGTAIPSNFTLTVTENGNNLGGSPFPGSASGKTFIVNNANAHTFTVSEDPSSNYTASYSGDCNASGVVYFSKGSEDQLTCTITNTYKAVPVYGCKDPAATNYTADPIVISKPSLCTYPGGKACKDPAATNYNPNPALTADNSLCNYPDPNKYACKDPLALNYNPNSGLSADNDLCNYPELTACKDPAALNYDSDAKLGTDNSKCNYPEHLTACKDLSALNYDSDPQKHADNSKCNYPADKYACKDPKAINYDPNPDLLKDNTKCNYEDNKFLAAIKNGFGGKQPIWPMVVGIIGLASSAPGVVARAGHMLSTFVWGRKKIRGVVYDSNTKEPLDPVYVAVIDLATNQEVKNQFTDMEGRFGFVLPKGHYKVTAGKTNYQFPSVKLAGKVSDEVYDRLYFGQPFTVEDEEQVVSMNIPMDPIGVDWNQVQKHKESFLHYLVRGQTKFAWLFNALFIIGFLASIMITYFYPTWWNYVMTGMYVVLGLIQVYGHGPIHAGKVTRGGQSLAYGIVRVWSASLNREIAKKVVESTGFYYILVPQGDYFIVIDQRNPDGTYTQVFTSNTFHARNGVINKSFDL